MTTLLEFKENPGGRPAVNFSFHPEEENGGEKKEIHAIEAGMVGRHSRQGTMWAGVGVL